MIVLFAACAPVVLKVSSEDEGATAPTESGTTELIADGDDDGFGPGLDCDDEDPTVNPDADEICDGVDNDCDDEVDEGLTATDYDDADGDGYGDDATAFSTCDEPLVEAGGDCDDGDAAVHPDAEESCNQVDDDCDGELDEGVSSTRYEDADGDGYGTGEGYDGCDGAGNDRDCDDDDPSLNPAADDGCDGVDDDCDGTADDDDADCDGVLDVPAWGGTGADGPLEVTGDTVLDAAWAVVGIAGDEVTLDGDTSALAAGDEVLLVNLHGSDDAYASVGVYEFAAVSAVDGSTVTLASITRTWGETSNDDLTGQSVQLVRVWQFTDVTVDAAGAVTVSAWDGATGGVLALRVQDTLAIDAGGSISVAEAGYAGGAAGSTSNDDAYQGESWAGEGGGGHGSDGGGYNESYGFWAANHGGGGAHITGGGGEHGGGATPGDSWDGGGATPPEAGEAYGEADLSRMLFGSGGGGVWNDGSRSPGPGGAGGGILFVAARDVLLDDAGALVASGGTTTAGAQGSWTYGAGGGAGGSAWIVARSIEAADGALDATGGLGQSSCTRAGGDGGDGRVRVDCVTVNGDPCGADALAGPSEPDPGYAGSPG